MTTRIVLVDHPDQLGPALAGVTDHVVGVDVERADADNYHRRAALVQVGDADRCVLVDPLAIPEPTALVELCRERLVVLHALENDLRPLEMLGVEVPRLADTAIAAGLLGLPIGLSDLLAEVLGVELDLDKSRYQRADWSTRPLSEGMIAYAAGDVLDLPELWRAMAERLDHAGRTEWYEQELAATVAAARVDSRSWDRTKGSGRLAPDERAVLRALWARRESICQRFDIAPNRLLHDRTLLSLAQEPAPSPSALEARDPRRRRGPIRDHADELFAAQEAGRAADPLPVPRRRRWSDQQQTAFDEMRRHRSAVAEDLDLDPGLLCPSRQLRAGVSFGPTSPSALADAADLRPWQQDLLLDDLWRIWSDTTTGAGGGGPDRSGSGDQPHAPVEDVDVGGEDVGARRRADSSGHRLR